MENPKGRLARLNPLDESVRSELLSALGEFGFDGYERSVYIQLLASGQATAKSLSQQARIPEPKVYQALARLRETGLVTIATGFRPAIYRVLDPEVTISALANTKKQKYTRKIDVLSSRIGNLSSSLAKGTHREISWVIDLIGSIETDDRKFEIVRSLTGRIFREAKEEICIMTGGFKWAREVESDLLSAINRGVKVRVLRRSESVGDSDGPEIFRKLGLQEKTYSPFNIRLSVVDGDKRAILVLFNVSKQPIFSDEANMPSNVYYTENPFIVRVLYIAFNALWESPQLAVQHQS